MPVSPGSPFQETRVLYRYQGSLSQEWVTFNEDPFASRFRTKTANLVQIRPMWHCYNPLLIQLEASERAGYFFPGYLPVADEARDTDHSIAIVVTRGPPFSFRELGPNFWHIVQNGQLYAVTPALPLQVPTSSSSVPNREFPDPEPSIDNIPHSSSELSPPACPSVSEDIQPILGL